MRYLRFKEGLTRQFARLAVVHCLFGCSEAGVDATGILDAKFQFAQVNDAQIILQAQFERSGHHAGEEAKLGGGDRVYVTQSSYVSEITTPQPAFDAYRVLDDELLEIPRIDEPNDTPAFWSAIRDNRWVYEKQLPAITESEKIYFAFLREGGEAVDRSSVALPSAFSINTPVAGTILSRTADDLLVEWTNLLGNIDEVYVRVLVDCGNNNTDEYNESSNTDDGYLIIPAGTLSQNVNLEGECDTEITVIKRNEGTIDPAFAEGYITAVQVRTVNITTGD